MPDRPVITTPDIEPTVTVRPGESVMDAKRRQGYRDPGPRDPGRRRIRCQARALARVPECWREAHRAVSYEGETFHLCPQHADDAEVAVAAIVPEPLTAPEPAPAPAKAPEWRQSAGLARYPRRTALTPSRSPEARRAEKERAKARKAAQKGPSPSP